MASKSKITYLKRLRKTKNAGRKRKNALKNRGTTLPATDLFQDKK